MTGKTYQMLQTHHKVFRIVPRCPKMSTSDASLSERTCFLSSEYQAPKKTNGLRDQPARIFLIALVLMSVCGLRSPSDSCIVCCPNSLWVIVTKGCCCCCCCRGKRCRRCCCRAWTTPWRESTVLSTRWGAELRRSRVSKVGQSVND